MEGEAGEAGAVRALLEAGLLSVLEAGSVQQDTRVVACVVRWLGLFAAHPDGFSAVAQHASSLAQLNNLATLW